MLVLNSEGARLGERDADYSPVSIMQLRETIAKQDIKINLLREKLRQGKAETKTHLTKISFLENLIIGKDNNEHAAIRKLKRVEKENE